MLFFFMFVICYVHSRKKIEYSLVQPYNSRTKISGPEMKASSSTTRNQLARAKISHNYLQMEIVLKWEKNLF